MVSWPRADVVILTAIELEYAAVKFVDAGAAPGSRWIEEKHKKLPVALREFVGRGGSPLRVVVARAPYMGKGSALNTLLPLVNALRPSCIAMCGVLAGEPGKTNLGDVVAGERLYDYDAGKQKDGGLEADIRTYSVPGSWKVALEQFEPKARFSGEGWWQGRPIPYEWQENWVLSKLLEGIKKPQALPDWKARCPQWTKVIQHLRQSRELKQKVLELTKRGEGRAQRLVDEYPEFPDLSPGSDFMPFKLHVETIASGSAVREDSKVWRDIKPHMRKAVALEMEASALADIVHAREEDDPVKAVVMKGVMDFANHGRDDQFKEYAARASAECLIAFLREQISGTPALAGVPRAPGGESPSGGEPPPSSASARPPRGPSDLLDDLAPWTRASPDATGAPGAGEHPDPKPAPLPPEVLARLARMEREIVSAMRARPRPFEHLASRLGCEPAPERLARHLVSLRGSVVAKAIVDGYRKLPSIPEYDADRDALRSVLFAVLPFVADWQSEVVSCVAHGDGPRKVIELPYRSDTIAEAVMAAWMDRRCEFEPKFGAEPYGRGMVQIPAAGQTALFTDAQSLLNGVVNQLASQLDVGGLNPDEKRMRVQARLQDLSSTDGPDRMRYYFLFRDVASPDPVPLWQRALDTLHGESGLSSLVLVRMKGILDEDQANLETYVAAILRSPASSRS